jgi:hypothetical protein
VTGYCSFDAGTHEQWLLTGDPGAGFPPYRHVFPSEEEARQFLDTAKAFRRNVADIELSSRTVTVTEWQPQPADLDQAS